jgi:cell division protein FtsI (penicillin-binding protein 3)
VTRVVNSRIRLLLLAIFVAFAAILARTAWLSTVRAASLSSMSQAQTKADIVLPAGRGTIFDSMGAPLALGEQATTVYADPREVTQPRREAVTAARILGLKPNDVLHAITARNTHFSYVARKAQPGKATLLAKRKLPGFHFYGEEQRTYPQGLLAAPVLGYAGVDNKGLSGLELALDSRLTGVPGKQTIVRDPAGQAIDIQNIVPAKPGKAVFLTLDHTIQANAEQVLRATVKQWRAKSAAAVVLDPKTGGILAMANTSQSAITRGLQKNNAVTDVFEPGSVFKIVAAAGALSEGLVTPQTKFTLPYSIQVADRIIHDSHPRGTETMTVAEILQRSSNVGVITFAKMLGKERLLRWIDRFGFGNRTGIDFPGESRGLLPSYWSGSTIGNVPIGQGISTTAVQLAAAYAAIANGGVWTQPHLVDHVQGEKPPAPKTHRVMSRSVNRQLLTILKGVASDFGTAPAAEIPGYSVAGKTGTAQKPSPRGGYEPGKYVATFVGMVPASNPKLVVLVTVDEPSLNIFGGIVAAPAFAQIAAFDLQYLEVPPDLALR